MQPLKAMKSKGLWNNTLFLFSADNGGVGKFGNNYPLRGHKHDPWEGGTRSTAFLSGGFIPPALRGSSSGDKLIHIADWYATFSILAGADPTNSVIINGSMTHVDSVNVWPLLTGINATQPRPITPTSETGIIETATDHADPWWKLITLAGRVLFPL
jgi:hypothetical protein